MSEQAHDFGRSYRRCYVPSSSVHLGWVPPRAPHFKCPILGLRSGESFWCRCFSRIFPYLLSVLLHRGTHAVVSFFFLVLLRCVAKSGGLFPIYNVESHPFLSPFFPIPRCIMGALTIRLVFSVITYPTGAIPDQDLFPHLPSRLLPF